VILLDLVVVRGVSFRPLGFQGAWWPIPGVAACSDRFSDPLGVVSIGGKFPAISDFGREVSG
jgi:hypothetical protein